MKNLISHTAIKEVFDFFEDSCKYQDTDAMEKLHADINHQIKAIFKDDDEKAEDLMQKIFAIITEYKRQFFIYGFDFAMDLYTRK